MNIYVRVLRVAIVLCILGQPVLVWAQTPPAGTSSRSAADYDAQRIDLNIGYSQETLVFARTAMERGYSAEVKEFANEVFTDFTGILYSMEQLASAGYKTSASGTISAADPSQASQQFREKLAAVRGFGFDTTWIAGMIHLHKVRYDGLLEEKENATNSRLKTAVSEALPAVRRHLSRMSSLQKMLIRRDIQEKKEAARNKKQ